MNADAIAKELMQIVQQHIAQDAENKPFDALIDFLAVRDAADMLKAQAAEIERLTRERDIAIGERVARSKLALRLRMAFIDICDSLEDEGDRVYFGSTNDADAFREVVAELDTWNWHDIMRDEKEVDPFKTSRDAVKRAEEAEAKVAALTEALRKIAWLRPGGPTSNRLIEQMERIAINALDTALGAKP